MMIGQASHKTKANTHTTIVQQVLTPKQHYMGTIYSYSQGMLGHANSAGATNHLTVSAWFILIKGDNTSFNMEIQSLMTSPH